MEEGEGRLCGGGVYLSSDKPVHPTPLVASERCAGDLEASERFQASSRDETLEAALGFPAWSVASRRRGAGGGL
jgi:hypothetical protein